MIDLETGDVNLFKCKNCVSRGNTLFTMQLYYVTQGAIFNHLKEVHDIAQPELNPERWIKYIQYIMDGEQLNDLKKAKQELEERRRAIYLEAAKNCGEEVIDFRFSHG